jgi:sugar-specific transcriptional regulator TrmB
MDLETISAPEQKELSDVLGAFGLDEKEQKVYFALLSAGTSTMTPLAGKTGLPPTTVQSVLNRLSEKGLLDVSQKKSRHEYSAHDPKVLKNILERQIRDMDNIIPILKRLGGNEEMPSRIRIFYRERVADIFHEALNAREKFVHEIVSARDFQKVIGEKFHFTKRRIEKGVRLKSLRVQKHEIKKYNRHIHERELREAKCLPPELDFRASVMFWDSTVAFFTTRGEGLAWTVESRAIAAMMRQIFDLLWSVSRRMETLQGE